MIDPRTPEGVAHLARLSRLPLGEEEGQAMQEHLDKILGWVAAFDRLDTDGVVPSHLDAALDLEELRADEVRPSLEPDQALANAPRRDGGGFSVPAVLSE